MGVARENKKRIPLTKLYAFTCIEDGLEKIVVDSDKVPFLYVSMEVVVVCNALDTIQELSNRSKQTYTLKVFELKAIIDTVIPEVTKMEV